MHTPSAGARAGDPSRSADQGGDGRVGTLRGASARVDPRRLLQATIAVVGATLLVLVVVFTVAGFHTNQQYDELHADGVPVTVTVTKCLGLLGGTGSNLVGYSCRGSYTLDGQRYEETIAGNTYRRPGSAIPAVAVPNDPRLVAPVRVLKTEHSSASVYIVPAVLTLALLALLGAVAVRRRAAHPPEGTGSTAPRSSRAVRSFSPAGAPRPSSS